jgi:hypothetical protein
VTKPTTETDADDKGSPPETGTDADSKPTDTDPEKGEGDGKGEESTEEEGRLKFLRGKLDEAVSKLKAFEDAEAARQRDEMTESEKLKADLETIRSENIELRRKMIATEHGLDDELAARLKGDTPEELAEDAKRLAELIGKKSPPKSPPAKDVGIGVPSRDGVPSDPVAAHRAAMAGRRF